MLVKEAPVGRSIHAFYGTCNWRISSSADIGKNCLTSKSNCNHTLLGFRANYSSLLHTIAHYFIETINKSMIVNFVVSLRCQTFNYNTSRRVIALQQYIPNHGMDYRQDNIRLTGFNTFRPEQNGREFSEQILKCISGKENHICGFKFHWGRATHLSVSRSHHHWSR